MRVIPGSVRAGSCLPLKRPIASARAGPAGWGVIVTYQPGWFAIPVRLEFSGPRSPLDASPTRPVGS